MPASSGNIVITGHDDDYHDSDQSKAQLTAIVAFARSGAPDPTLPVLVFDHGQELQAHLDDLGIKNERVDPNEAIPDPAWFDVRHFSAIGVASDASCGGCDNNQISSANLSRARNSFKKFFNAGGGLFAFAGGRNGTYYDFLPATVSSHGSPDNSGYEASVGGQFSAILPVNGDPTHNFFNNPGNGTDRLYRIIEVYSGMDHDTGSEVTAMPATLAIKGARIIDDPAGGERFTRANWMEAVMDTTSVVVTFALLAFMVERLTSGLTILLGYSRWWRSHMEVSSVAGAEEVAGVERNRRVGLFVLSALLAIIGAVLAKLNLLAQLINVGSTPAAAGYIITGLLIASGADPIRELLKLRTDREGREPPPIQVSGTLVLRQEPSQRQ